MAASPAGTPGRRELTLSSPVIALKGVGPRMVERLARLDIRRVEDLLFHLPAQYQDRSRIVPIGALRPGEAVTIQGEILLTEIKYGRRRMLLSRLSDGTGAITLRFFNFSRLQQQNLAAGAWLRCFGEVRKGPATLEMVHPEYQHVDPDAPLPGGEHLTPIYPATEGLRQLTLRGLVSQALDLLGDTASPSGLAELLPEDVLRRYALPPMAEAVAYLHRPPLDADVRALQEGRHPMQKRLVFEELLAHQLSLRLLRRRKQRQAAPPLDAPGRLREALLAQLPFALTGAQQRVIAELCADMARDTPMQRLVQGDVGSGKTLVAAAAVLQAVESGFQAAIMAPTELLAEQHHVNFRAWFDPLGIEVAWLGGKTKGRARRAALEAIGDGSARVVVGTHALFQDEVEFAAPGLVVVDEQHRFGVHQRLALREKGRQEGRFPHQLIMTATPIPRTLMMSAYADLDSSVIDELPPGRRPVTTVVVSERRRDDVLQRVRHACGEGRQAYWVCTLIEESDVLQCQAAEETARLLAEALPELSIALVHGRLRAEEKAQVMTAFKAGEIDLLVATTVIEVGVDVPNASLMIIENAERLGLAQLHQLRGRVGRGCAQSTCVLMYRPPLSQRGRERLAALRETNDGFEIARRDLELRGPGEVLGTRQAGALQFRVADVLRDQALLPHVAETARWLLAHHPGQARPLVRRWLGQRTRYTAV
ncbi:MAG TPA: ATP-dependent DNA helicase RecG [Gammaproteobacteria bacterium]|nr:ATP-dependent DNA helicase RecG [Gammaproteobacteria bacterium]